MGECRRILLMGDTGSTKTTQCALVAKWLFENYAIKTKYVSCDGGGASQFDELGLVDEGIVDIFELDKAKYTLAALSYVSKGYWPNGSTDDDGNIIIKKTEEYKVDFDTTHWAYMVDSLSGLGESLGEYISNPSRQIGSKLANKSVDDDYELATLDKPHYQIIQKEMTKAIRISFPALPISHFICTARIERAEDMNKSAGYYPALFGKALCTKVGGWFHDSLHLDNEAVTGSCLERNWRASVKDKESLVGAKVAWFQDHNDHITDIPYRAKIRLLVGREKLLERFKEGYVVLDTKFGVVRLYDAIEKIREEIKTNGNR